MAGESLSRSEIDGKLQQLETKLKDLRRDYEQFFVGARERPPRNTRKQVDRLVRELEGASVTNTSQKFRLRGLVQRYTSYKQKWNRVERQIEQGTYAPHKKRAKRRMEDKEGNDRPEGDSGKNDGGQAEDDVVELDVEMENVDLGDLERELQEMDDAGEFEKYTETERMDESDFQEAERQQRQRRPQNQGGDNSRRRRPPSDPEQQSNDRDRGSQSGDSGSQRRDADPDKLREIQDKLGLSSGSDKTGDKTKDKLKSMRQKLDGDGPDEGGSNRRKSKRSSTPPSGGAKREDVEKLRRAKEKKQNQSSGPDRREKPRRKNSDKKKKKSNRSDSGSGRQNRVIERTSNRRRRSSRQSSSDEDSSSSDDDEETHEAIVYEQLIAAKEDYGEPTDHLDFETVCDSMVERRFRLIDERGVDDVFFQVVVKDERVYLQPILFE